MHSPLPPTFRGAPLPLGLDGPGKLAFVPDLTQPLAARLSPRGSEVNPHPLCLSGTQACSTTMYVLLLVKMISF